MKKVILSAAIIITAAIMLNAQTDTIVFQQGLNDYTGCRDKEIRDPEKDRFRPQVIHILVLSEY
jgi:hypothetical protein